MLQANGLVCDGTISAHEHIFSYKSDFDTVILALNYLYRNMTFMAPCNWE